MKTIKNPLYFVLSTLVLLSLSSCEPKALTEDDVFVQETELDALLADENPEGYDIYTLNDFLDRYMTEKGNFWSDTSQYRERATNGNGFYLFSVDTLPTYGRGIYIRGRITTDDYEGNFYKSMVIQQIVGGKQQNLRISVDLGSSHGMYQLGQEIIIRCNGLSVGRYSNQPQLCVPSYNNNIYAMNASQKVGWAPGRIPGSVFRRNTKMIGLPDRSKLQYDTLSLGQLFTEIPRKPSIDATGMDQVRKLDGRLVVLKNVSFSGKYQDGNNIVNCVVGHPDSVGGANVFAPSTQNIGYPQGRLLCDIMDANPATSSTTIMCSNSEYAKFAYFYLPGANKTGITGCRDYEGTVTGILGWYQDKASDLTASGLDGYEWSVTPRGIGITEFGIKDVVMYYHGDTSDPWTPKEYDPNDK